MFLVPNGPLDMGWGSRRTVVRCSSSLLDAGLDGSAGTAFVDVNSAGTMLAPPVLEPSPLPEGRPPSRSRAAA